MAQHRAEELLLALSLAYSHSGAQLFLKKNVGFLGQGLSGGEQARVALGRILFEDPETILLDEPTANLDAASAQAFWQALENWKHHHPERTLVTVTHSLHEVGHFDYAYVFEEGTVVKQGTVAEVVG
jgi:ABC-type transport system involved in cytochrome bd biosynthesis fused ATPase/permease subunit